MIDNRTASQQKRTWDLLLTVLLSILVAYVGMCLGVVSLWFGYSALFCDTLGCRPGYGLWAMVIALSGIGLALIGSLLVILLSARMGRLMWYWPLAGLLMQAVAFTAGLWLSSNV